MHILLIDDSKEDRDLIVNLIKRMKTKYDIFVSESNCLKDALYKIKETTYDAIILDLILPESDGIDTIKTIVDNLHNYDKNTPVIVLTGLEDYKVGREAFDMGIKDFLIKDEITMADLMRALNFATFNEKKSVLK